ncbi:DNA polymerase beta [Durusdinium trenchii]|uniref:DNA polymerase n=1 Tax=Durusdinium trenchii TaxID=1381693 RepID=A0ABP0R1Y9_9DINO
MSVVQRLKRDRFRSQAYAKAAQALRALAEPIDSGAQAKAIKGIGAGMANRIDVILKTGELKELEELKLDSDVVALRELRSVLRRLRVHGIGAVSAAKLVERGIRSLAQLRDAVEKNQVHLDSAQALGLRHCEEFSKRIPQAEMKEHHKLLEQCCLKGHPDLLLTVESLDSKGMRHSVSTLKKAGYVTGDLAFGQTKFMGVCRLSRGHLHRRLDIRCMPEDQYHFGSSVARSRLVEPANIDRLL